MKNEIEKYGASRYDLVTFNFDKLNTLDVDSKEGEDRKLFLSENNINDNDFNFILNFQ